MKALGADVGERVLHNQDVSPVVPAQAGVLSPGPSLNAQHLEKHLVHSRPSGNICSLSDWNESGTVPGEGAEVTSGGLPRANTPELESGAVLIGGSASRGPSSEGAEAGAGQEGQVPPA